MFLLIEKEKKEIELIEKTHKQKEIERFLQEKKSEEEEETDDYEFDENLIKNFNEHKEDEFVINKVKFFSAYHEKCAKNSRIFSIDYINSDAKYFINAPD